MWRKIKCTKKMEVPRQRRIKFIEVVREGFNGKVTTDKILSL